MRTERIELFDEETAANKLGRHDVGASVCFSLGFAMLAIWLVTLMIAHLNAPGRIASQAFAETKSPTVSTAVVPLNSMVCMDVKYLRNYHWYHWREDCPIYRPSDHSMTPWKKSRAAHWNYLDRHRIFLTRREADARGMKPCPYCSELGKPNLRLPQSAFEHHRP